MSFKKIFGLASILFTIIYMIFVYLDLGRYVRLHYTKDLQQVLKAKNEKEEIIIVLTPTQRKNIKPVIASLLDQTVPPLKIFVNKSSDQNITDQDELTKYINVTPSKQSNIHFTEQSLLQGIIPIIKNERKAGVWVISLRPEKIYNRTFIEDIISYCKNTGNSLVSPDVVVVNTSNTYITEDGNINFTNQTKGIPPSILSRGINLPPFI